MTARIVIADDDKDIRRLMEIAAERAGVEIVAAVDNGQDAWDEIRKGGIDLAVLDLSMPKLNGLEVLQNVRAEPSLADTRILVVSASVQLIAAGAALKEHADQVVLKPFSPRALAIEISSLVDETAVGTGS